MQQSETHLRQCMCRGFYRSGVNTWKLTAYEDQINLFYTYSRTFEQGNYRFAKEMHF